VVSKIGTRFLISAGVRILRAMRTFCLWVGSFHETAKVVNSLQVSTAGLTRCRQYSPSFP